MITDYIPYGHDNAITAPELSRITGTPERDIRREINLVRRETVILNMQDGKGYFQPTPEENSLVEDWVKQEESRLKVHALALRAGRRRVKECKE